MEKSLNKIRVRFAPSPTGIMHIGNLRTALYTYLFARKNKGVFILRIEDTDQKRFVPEAIEAILNSFKKAGLTYDEGYLKGGDYGPYVQSERKDLYLKYAKQLVEKGQAYYCFCSEERLKKLREQAKEQKRAFKYDGHCKQFSEDEVKEKLASEEKYVIRQKIPDKGETEVKDLVYGTWKVKNKEIEEQVLIKSDGLPTYNFANVVDDHLMKISHVIRGGEYISSAPKYVLLYQAFGWEIPDHIHLSSIVGEDGKKLSKRRGDATFEDLVKQGYLPEAIVNYIALLGWNPGTEKEIYTLKELEKDFSVKGLQKSPAKYDIKKLQWVNSEHIKMKSTEELIKICKLFFNIKFEGEYKDKINGQVLEKIVTIEKTRMNTLVEIGDQVMFYFKDHIKPKPEDLIWKKQTKGDMKKSLEKSLEVLESLEEDKIEDLNYIKEIFMEQAKKYNKDRGVLLWPLRVALTGEKNSPSPFEAIWLLAKEKSIERIQTVIKLLS